MSASALFRFGSQAFEIGLEIRVSNFVKLSLIEGTHARFYLHAQRLQLERIFSAAVLKYPQLLAVLLHALSHCTVRAGEPGLTADDDTAQTGVAAGL